MVTDRLSFLNNFETKSGIRFISVPREFQHPEEDYDAQYNIARLEVHDLRREGSNVLDFAEREGWKATTPILEIGCGTGRLSLGLALQPRVGRLLVTDASTKFLHIVKRKIEQLRTEASQIDLIVLRGEDLRYFPEASIGMIILRSVLHHVDDVGAFLTNCSRVLESGGLIICEEPYYEGYQLMGFAAQFLPAVIERRGRVCTKEQQQLIRLFVDAMQFYCRRDLDKSHAEDKHLFRPDELMQSALLSSMSMKHYPNRYITVSDQDNLVGQPGFFARFFHDYLVYCMNWPADFAKEVKERMGQYLSFFDPLLQDGFSSPHCYGLFVFRKTA